MIPPDNFFDEVQAIKKYVQQAVNIAAEKAVQEAIADVQSRIKVITQKDFNGRVEWYIMSKDDK